LKRKKTTRVTSECELKFWSEVVIQGSCITVDLVLFTVLKKWYNLKM